MYSAVNVWDGDKSQKNKWTNRILGYHNISNNILTRFLNTSLSKSLQLLTNRKSCLALLNYALTFFYTGDRIYSKHNLIDCYEMMRPFRQMSDSPWTFFLQEKQDRPAALTVFSEFMVADLSIWISVICPFRKRPVPVRLSKINHLCKGKIPCGPTDFFFSYYGKLKWDFSPEKQLYLRLL